METPKKSATSRMRADPVLAMTLDMIYDKVMRIGHPYEDGTLAQIGYAIARHLGLDCPGVPLTESYIQSVPDRCDRIIWRGSYYCLPTSSTSEPLVDPTQSASAEEVAKVASERARSEQLREYDQACAAAHAANAAGLEAAAIRTLNLLGYSYHGGELFKPPLGTPPEHLLDGEQQNQPEPGKHDTASGPSNTAAGTMDVESDFASEPASLVVGKRYRTADGECFVSAVETGYASVRPFICEHSDGVMRWHSHHGRNSHGYHITSLTPLPDEPATRHAELAAEAAAKIGDALGYVHSEGGDATEVQHAEAQTLVSRILGFTADQMAACNQRLPEGFLFHLTVGRRPKA